MYDSDGKCSSSETKQEKKALLQYGSNISLTLNRDSSKIVPQFHVPSTSRSKGNHIRSHMRARKQRVKIKGKSIRDAERK